MNRKKLKKLSRKQFATFLLATYIIFSPTKIFAEEETIEIPIINDIARK